MYPTIPLEIRGIEGKVGACIKTDYPDWIWQVRSWFDQEVLSFVFWIRATSPADPQRIATVQGTMLYLCHLGVFGRQVEDRKKKMPVNSWLSSKVWIIIFLIARMKWKSYIKLKKNWGNFLQIVGIYKDLDKQKR